MTAIPEKKLYTFEEYLALEEASETRYEYWDGEVFAMAGTTKRHNRMVLNLSRLLYPFTQKKGCEVFAESIKQQLRERSRYVYPDIIYSCDPEDVEADDGQWVKNPSLLIEVLSDSTEGVDREKKRDAYFLLPSLQVYIILAQDRYSARVYQRAGDFWRYELLTNSEDEIRLPALGIMLKLADVYEGVRLKPNS